ncbi:hypothetical protein BKA62DRAFT_680461 [Auriculariales sp. MPI-PUGE-AT-0066]|nr:hypothetical protein BKA62DRAFT_680461 [Auriculariales sp. MPI-PUGE-AT-0066]
MARGRGGRGYVPQVPPPFSGGRGTPRGRGRGGNRGGRGGPSNGGPNIRRPDLHEDMMEQVEDFDDDDLGGFNFGLSFATLGGSSSRGNQRDRSPPPRGGRGAGRGGRGGGGRGRGGSSYAFTDDVVVGPSGRGTAGKRTKGSGLGVTAVIDPSKLPDFGRQLLRPVIFVRSTLHATLFKNVDEVLQAHEIKLEDEAESEGTSVQHAALPHHRSHDIALSHAPTSDRVAEVFGAPVQAVLADPTEDEAAESSEQPARVDTPAEIVVARTTTATKTVAKTESSLLKPMFQRKSSMSRLTLLADDALFVVDATPNPNVQINTGVVAENTTHLTALGDDEDVIVYPPSRAGTPAIGGKSSAMKRSEPLRPIHAMNLHRMMQSATVIDESLARTRASPAFIDPAIVSAEPSAPSSPAPFLDPAIVSAEPSTPAPVATSSAVTIDGISFRPPSKPLSDAALGRTKLTRAEQLRERVKGKQGKRKSAFGMLGALMAEARVREEARERQTARGAARRVEGDRSGKGRDGGREGDSDLDWGTESEDGDGLKQEAGGTGEPDESLASMDVDPEVDEAAYSSFVHGLARQQHVTIDDLADAEQMRVEDEEAEEEDSENDDEEGEEPSDEEEALIREFLDEEGSSDDDEDPVTSFDKRLKAIRANQHAALDAMEDDEDGDEAGGHSKSRSDEAFIANINGKGKKRQTFEAVFNGDFELDSDEEDFFRISWQDFVNDDLRKQWEKDRSKKAEKKREREAQRAEAELGAMTPRQAKQMGKRFLKDNRNKGPATGEIITRNGRPTDLNVVDAEIRAFVRDLRRHEMALPPLDKTTRARVHQIATSFGLKSKSQGKGDNRFITLYRTTRTRETATNERKVARLVAGTYMPGMPQGPRHKEGDEVGKSAPKLTDSNLGFRLLAQMGWQEGDRIGLSAGGLEVPIAAFFKKSKLGLGATSGQ